MKVGAGYASGCSDPPNNLSLPNFIPLLYQGVTEVQVAGNETGPMIQVNDISTEIESIHQGNCSLIRRANGCSCSASEIHAGMPALDLAVKYSRRSEWAADRAVQA